MYIVQGNEGKDPLFEIWYDLYESGKERDAIAKLREYPKYDNIRIVKIYAEYKKELKLIIRE